MTAFLTALSQKISGVLTAPARYAFWLPNGPDRAPRLLMYHSVDPDAAQDGLTIHPEHFERQIVDLKERGYRFLTAAELSDAIARGERDFSKTAVLTFDDGFEDNYTQAFPILKKHGAKATIYLSPGYERIRFLQNDQIAEMAQSGFIEFGAHTYSHVNLTRLSDAEAENEILKSKSVAETLSRHPCVSFSYPYGRFTSAHEEMVRKAGFTSAVSTKKRLRIMSPDQLFHLPRLTVDGRMNRLQWRILLKKGKYRL